MKITHKRFSNIDEYIETFPDHIAKKLQQLRHLIHKTAPKAVETISYNMPAFKINGSGLVYFAAFNDHLSLYPYAEAMGLSKKDSIKYKTSGKGTLQLPLDEDLPVDIIQKFVKYRLKIVG